VTNPPPKTIAAALLVAQQLLPGVLKDSKNDFHKYKYVSSESMIREARAALHGAGLSLSPTSAEVLSSDALVALGVPAVLRAQWVLVHGETGETMHLSFDWPIVPEKGRPVDKALASARTTGLGYLLRDLLLAPRVDREDDMDWSGRDRLGVDAPPAAPPPAPPAPEPPAAPPGDERDFQAAADYLRGQGLLDTELLLESMAPDARRMTKRQLAPIVKKLVGGPK